MITDGWKLVVADGSQTLPQLCQTYNLNLESVININTQLINYYDLSEDQREELAEFPTTREYLRSITTNNSPVTQGLEIRLPGQAKGGLGDVGQTSLYYDDRSSEILAVSSRNAWTDEDLSKLPKLLTSSSAGQSPTSAYTPTNDDLSYYAYQSRNSTWSAKDYPITSTLAYKHGYGYNYNAILMPEYQLISRQHKHNCKYWIYSGTYQNRQWGIQNGSGEGYYLPIYPNEVTVSTSARYSPQSIFGRSVDYQIYTGSQRSVSLTLVLHAELYQEAGYPADAQSEYLGNPVNTSLKEEVARIESACYPYYGVEGEVIPPEFALQIGNHFYIKGILENVSANWKAPIIDNGLVSCELSLSIVETNGPYSSDEVQKMKGLHGLNRSEIYDSRYDDYGAL